MFPIGESIPEPILREHIAHLQGLMRQEGLTAVLLFHPSNMLAFTGTPHASSDRLTCGAVTLGGDVRVVCPAFEHPAVAGANQVATVHTWQDHEDPFQCFAAALADAGVSAGVLGVDGRVWYEWWHLFANACPKLRLKSAERLLREVRICKTPAELEVLRAAHGKGERVFFEMQERLRAGVSELDLHRELAEHFQRDGLAVSPYIQSGPNGSRPHNPPGSRTLREGDTVVMDSVIIHDGYNNDLTRTFALGEPSARAKKAYKVVRQAQKAAIEAARPGAQCGQLDRIARHVITEAGFGEFFTHRLGHGIGIECHEPPYLHSANNERLRPGMCTTIEPGIYVPGEFGIRIEDDIIITNDGCEIIHGDLPTDVSGAFDRT